MFGVPNVLEKDTIEHNDITSIKVIYNTILDPGDLGKACLACERGGWEMMLCWSCRFANSCCAAFNSAATLAFLSFCSLSLAAACSCSYLCF
jgi:hypothetical protein